MKSIKRETKVTLTIKDAVIVDGFLRDADGNEYYIMEELEDLFPNGETFTLNAIASSKETATD